MQKLYTDIDYDSFPVADLAADIPAGRTIRPARKSYGPSSIDLHPAKTERTRTRK